jgi:hypothetical protein
MEPTDKIYQAGPQRIWVIGAGKFGRISVDALKRLDDTTQITVVDNDPQQLEHMDASAGSLILGDGIEFLDAHLLPPKAPDWIIPVIPVHVVAEWIALRISKTRAVRHVAVPECVIASLPNPMHGADKAVYTSLADFLCPDDCPQPPERCTCTGKPRPYNLYDRLAALETRNLRSVVVVSHQLAPGVGALSPPELFQALDRVASHRSPCLVATACRCHGIVSALSFDPDQ